MVKINKKRVWRDLFFTVFIFVLSTIIAFILSRLVHESLVNVALIYILCLIFISRYTTGYWYGIFASLFCVVFINFCFTFPYFEINFTLTGYPITFLEMLSISILTSMSTSYIIRQSQILAEREKELMEADKEKMRANLLRAISHDLRTPLTSITGAISTYQDSKSSYTELEKEELISHIYDDSKWLLHMVENLLSVTRIQNGSAKVKTSYEAVEEVISEAVCRLKKRLPEATVHVQIPEELLLVPMDPMLIEQVIMNLLENAYIHSKSSRPIELTITATNDIVSFHVVDYGIGIDENKILDMFNGIPSTDSHTADSKKGMGIGLSICKTIITAHKGNIYARNHDHGAEFVFELPRDEH